MSIIENIPSTESASPIVQDAREALDALEERLRNGDSTVTPAALGKVRDQLAHAELVAEAEQRAAEAARRAKLDQEAEQWATNLDRHNTNDLAALQAAYVGFVAAISEFRGRLKSYAIKADALDMTRERLNRAGLDLAGTARSFDHNEYWNFAVNESERGYHADRSIRFDSAGNQIVYASHALHDEEASAKYAQMQAEWVSSQAERDRLAAEEDAERRRQTDARQGAGFTEPNAGGVRRNVLPAPHFAN
ncbi:hypothetical protein [Rhodococcus sp. NPDC127528]|uniref:hypothetical protein n=1 Tax=unclassified Rhodococcus (in: high G+C Gram-positive bacteria) TaxID=192944 RepID=UPI003634E4A0